MLYIVGLKSTSLYFGDRPQLSLASCATGMITGLLLAGYNCHLSTPFYIGILVTTGHLMWQIATVDVRDRENLWYRFRSNQYVGGIVFAAIVAGKVIVFT